jgi:allophanate hydrolase subunit 2
MMLEVRTLHGFATVQDGGRPGHMHEGVPPGGALVPELLARANDAVGNAHGEAGIELVGAMALVADARLEVATCDGEARVLEAGDALEIAPVGRDGACVRYVAVRGGIDVPRVLGGHGTLVVAALGGHEGRPLRKGDRLRVGHAPALRMRSPCPPDLLGPIEVVLGPDEDRFHPGARDALLGGPFVVQPRRDRMGMRLAGPLLERADRDAGFSAPMVRGAIQVPASSPARGPHEIIVLGPDHPTTGGYPVLATVVGASLGSLFARPVGFPVRFVLAYERPEPAPGVSAR